MLTTLCPNPWMGSTIQDNPWMGSTIQQFGRDESSRVIDMIKTVDVERTYRRAQRREGPSSKPISVSLRCLYTSDPAARYPSPPILPPRHRGSTGVLQHRLVLPWRGPQNTTQREVPKEKEQRDKNGSAAPREAWFWELAMGRFGLGWRLRLNARRTGRSMRLLEV